MNIDINQLTVAQIKEIGEIFFNSVQKQPIMNSLSGVSDGQILDNKMIGKYVIVRCKDAGVHAGTLVAHSGREAVLTGSRRLWFWRPANGQKYLSGIAVAGLHSDSKLGAPLERLHLTETCEIIQVHQNAIASIVNAPTDETK